MRLSYNLVMGVSVVAASIIAIVAVQTFVTSQPTNNNPQLPRELILGDYGDTVSVEEAERMVGYEVKLPVYLPADNELQMIKIDKNTMWWVAFYSPSPVNDFTTERDLIDNNGFIILNAPALEIKDADKEVRDWVEQFGGSQIQIDGITGVAITNVPLAPGYSEIHWWDSKLHRFVGAKLDLSELARIVRSV